MDKAKDFKGYNGIFATRLRGLMSEGIDGKKTTQQDLAVATGYTRQAISQYMDGSVIPNAEKLAVISKFFNVSSDYLLGLSDIPSRDINLSAVCDYTGLSEKSVTRLKRRKDGRGAVDFERDASNCTGMATSFLLADVETRLIDLLLSSDTSLDISMSIFEYIADTAKSIDALKSAIEIAEDALKTKTAEEIDVLMDNQLWDIQTKSGEFDKLSRCSYYDAVSKFGDFVSTVLTESIRARRTELREKLDELISELDVRLENELNIVDRGEKNNGNDN